MFLSKRPSNGIYYLFFFDELGKRQCVSTRCKLKTDALKFLQDFKRTEQERKVKVLRVSLSQFKEDYLRYSAGVHTPKTQESNKTALEQLVKVVGDIPLHRMGVREIENFLAVKKRDASGWTARKYYIALASAFEKAKQWNLLVSNPFRQVEKPKVPELQPVFLNKEEFKALLKVMKKDFRELCVCAVSTGLRLSELTALQWPDIDLARKVIHVHNSDTFTTKSKKNRVVPMSEQLFRLFAERNEHATSELVFHLNGQRMTKDCVSKTFKRYVRLARLNDKLHFHSLRHTFASWLVQDGVSLYEVQKLLGHSSSKVTEVYSHLQPEQLHGTVNRLNVSLN